MSDPTSSDPTKPEEVPTSPASADESVPANTTLEPASAPAAYTPPAAAPEPPAAEPPAYTAPEPAAAQPEYSAPEPAYAPPAAAPQPAYAPTAPTAPTQPQYAPAPPVYAPPPAAAPPGYGVPPTYPGPAGPPAGSRPMIFAIIAIAAAALGIILAILQIVLWPTGFLPVLALFIVAGLLLLVGFVFGLIALISKRQGGKPLAIAAVVVAVLGWIVSAVLFVASLGLMAQNAVNDAIDDGLGGGSQSDSGGDVASDAEDLVIDEAVFGQDASDGTWWYVIILDNPNDDYVYSYAEIDVEALDASGATLDSDSNYLTILSGQTAISGWFLDVGDAVVDDLYVSGPTADEAEVAPLEDTGTLTFDNLEATDDGYSATVTGTLSGDFDQDQSLPLITVVARDASGNIIGGAWTYADTLPAGGSVDFEVDFYQSFPSDTTFEAYGAL
ncbi:MAG: FxLYD domain-containing protein [Microbacterium sp.]|uniref:FxLYD domain-containing protein n=1 Tax=Microbacterium sp. TaxID=51671 RepID=UPI0039E23612